MSPITPLKNNKTKNGQDPTRPYCCLNSFRSFFEKDPQASMLKSMAAANATKAAASSVHVTCFTPTSTVGLPLFPTFLTVEDITNPLYNWSNAADPSSNPDPDPDLEEGLDLFNDPDPTSQLPLGVSIAVTLEVLSTQNFPPLLELRVPAAISEVVSGPEKRWKR